MSSTISVTRSPEASTLRWRHQSRVVKSEFDPSRKQIYFYDNFGNLKQTSDTTPAGTQVRAVAIETKKNRMCRVPRVFVTAMAFCSR